MVSRSAESESQVEELGVNSSCIPGLRVQSVLIVCFSGLLLLMYPSLRHSRNHATLSSSKASLPLETLRI